MMLKAHSNVQKARKASHGQTQNNCIGVCLFTKQKVTNQKLAQQIIKQKTIKPWQNKKRHLHSQ